MEGKLDFSLPPKKQQGTFTGGVLIILLLVLIALTAANLVIELRTEKQAPITNSSSLSPEQTKELAGKLARRDLYVRAADVWQDYLDKGRLDDSERARILFQIGSLQEKTGLYDQAIESFYRSETVAKLSELGPQINTHIKDCFEKLGKFSALRYELMDRTGMDSKSDSGGKVIAEIGAEKITEADLDASIESDIENQLQPVAVFMTAEQLNEQKKKMLDQYKDPKVKQQYLQSWLAQEMLYRQALKEQLTEQPEVKKLINRLMQGALSQYVMNRELASKINITDTDLQTYYAANKDKFVEPAKATISHILVDDQQQAEDLIGQINSGGDFGELAKQFSKDESTKQNGGKIEAEVQKGTYVSGIGNYSELNDKIFAISALPAVLDEPFKTDKGWEIVKVETMTAERQKSLDEVRQLVMRMLANQKSQDVQNDYIEQLKNEYDVVIHSSAFSGSKENNMEESTQAAK